MDQVLGIGETVKWWNLVQWKLFKSTIKVNGWVLKVNLLNKINPVDLTQFHT